MQSTKDLTGMQFEGDFKEVIVRRTGLFGLINWWEIVRSDCVGIDLVIKTDQTFNRVIINNKEYSVCKINYKNN